MVSDDMRHTLSEIADLLEAGREFAFAMKVRDKLNGSEEKLEQFLVSNELWGGSGSLADSAFVSATSQPDPPEKRKSNARAFRHLMIELGRTQITGGQVNARTRMWVEAFEKWQQMGLG